MFGVYCQSKRDCDLLRSVTIAGVISESVTTKAASVKPKKNDTMPWELSGADLCRAVMAKHAIEADAASCKVVVDATYGRDDALLLDINHIWGFSYSSWTPILLRMTTLFEGGRPKGKATPVEHFRLDSQEQDFVHEFLYLQCGHQGGTKSWGRMGYTNAALLWPDALVHLLGQIGFTRTLR
jgi:hypothetical protein